MSEYIVEMPKEPAKVVRDGWNVRIEWQYKQREEIVRCRDCKHYVEASRDYGVRTFCDYLDGVSVEPYGYCKWGERRGA